LYVDRRMIEVDAIWNEAVRLMHWGLERGEDDQQKVVFDGEIHVSLIRHSYLSVLGERGMGEEYRRCRLNN
jgi:hypothetical protein